MKYTGTYNLDLLHEELEALPGAISQDANSEKIAHYIIGVEPDGVVIKGLDDGLVSSVIAAHDPSKKSKNQLNKKQKAVDKQTALDKLKALGLTDAQLEALGL